MDKGLQGGKIMQGKFSDYLLVSDMDATLLDDNHTISEENRQAIDYFIMITTYKTVHVSDFMNTFKIAD